MIIPLDTGKVISQSYFNNTIIQNGTVYIDNKEYKTLNGNLSLISLGRIFNSEGFSVYLNGSLTYSYYHKGHLGNNREVWRAAYLRDGVTNIAANTDQQTQYYPSGLPWSEGVGASSQPYKYNGKEFVEMHGYDTYNYGARGYYPALGRFTSVDPLAEKKPWISPYVYCSGNPVRFVDPDGRGDVDKVEIELPEIYIHMEKLVREFFSSFGFDIQAPNGNSEDAAKKADTHNKEQEERRDEINDNLEQEASNIADNLETDGAIIQAGGYVLAPVTAGESLAIVPFGKGVEMTGSIINGVLDLSKGKTGKVVANGVSSIVFNKIGSKIEKLEKVGKIAKYESAFLQLITDVHEKTTNFFINFISKK